MDLIKETRTTRNKKGKLYRYGIFHCNICGKDSEKLFNNGFKAKSCGCKNGMYKHGDCSGIKRTRLYMVWASMKNRCYCETYHRYKDWGGRGIIVCNEWQDFIPFKNWALSNGYSDDLQIDRIDNNGNYEPSNCRFVSSAINNQNASHVKLNTKKASEIRELYLTGDYSQRGLGKIYGIDQSTVWRIVNNKLWK